MVFPPVVSRPFLADREQFQTTLRHFPGVMAGLSRPSTPYSPATPQAWMPATSAGMTAEEDSNHAGTGLNGYHAL
jgi:hypothetical protein